MGRKAGVQHSQIRNIIKARLQRGLVKPKATAIELEVTYNTVRIYLNELGAKPVKPGIWSL